MSARPEAMTMNHPVLRTAAGLLHWRRANATLLNGSLVMLAGTILVSVINFGYNVVVAQMLGPADFGHTSAAITLLMLVSAITLSFQLVCAKFVARNETAAGRSAVYAYFNRRAWMVGIGLAALMTLASGAIAGYLRLPTAWVVIGLAVGIAFYVPLGVKRGGLQGTCRFPRLSGTFIIESGTKFAGAVLLIYLLTQHPAVRAFGAGLLGENAPVVGAVAAISVSVVTAYFLPPVVRELRSRPGAYVPANAREGMQAIVFFVGQVIINNIDILLVKHFFPPREAGLYAAVALVGRVLYFASWSVVSAMFPVSAAAASKPEQRGTSVLAVPLLFVVSISALFILGLEIFGPYVIGMVFGSGFHDAGPLLPLYAAATGAYALSVVLMAYEMSRRIANTGWLQLLFSGLVIAGITLFHANLRQVIVVQIVLMLVLLGAVSLPFLRRPHAAALQEAA